MDDKLTLETTPTAEDLSAYKPEKYPPEHRWQGEGPPSPKWRAADGTIVYRSYADYCWD